MENEFMITDATMAQADTYIPLTMKEMIANDMARACVKRTDLIHPFGEKAEYSGEYGVSPVYCESPSSKARVMMTVLMVMYLHIWGEDTPYLCEVSDYDQWAGAHVLNQLERFKAGKYREKAFDILADYKDMERVLNSAIYAVLREKNDPVTRFIEAFGAMTSAEGIQAAIDSIKEAQDGIEAERLRQESIMRGEDAGNEGSAETAEEGER